MSVCFFVPAEQVASNEEVEAEASEENKAETAEQTLQQFWSKVMEDIKAVGALLAPVPVPAFKIMKLDEEVKMISAEAPYLFAKAAEIFIHELTLRAWTHTEDNKRRTLQEDFKTQPLPLTRIKKIMKLDEEVKMISAEAPVLFAKAAEIFIHELTLRAWTHTEDNKRRTLQRNDIAMAISKSDQFDFLIDIVPRHEMKPAKPRFETTWTGKTEQSSAPPQQVQTVSPQQLVVQPSCTQVLQTSSGASSSVQQPVIVQQVVHGSEVQNIPSQIQLTPAQLNMIRLQVQNNPTQPIIIQAQPQHSPQIIQVASQAQHQPQQQVYLAQVSTSQEES